MSIDDKRWSVGKNDIDRDNRLINRSPHLEVYMPSDDKKTGNFTKRNVFRKTFAVFCALLCYGLLFLIGKLLPVSVYDTSGFLIASLVLSWLVYWLVARNWHLKH